MDSGTVGYPICRVNCVSHTANAVSLSHTTAMSPSQWFSPLLVCRRLRRNAFELYKIPLETGYVASLNTFSDKKIAQIVCISALKQFQAALNPLISLK
jgi:hypothetical protein